MIHTIILIAFIILGIYLAFNDLEVVGSIMIIFFGVWLIGHSIEWASAEYDYEVFKAEMAAYQTTLDNVRSHNNEFETLSIASDILELNTRLARYKVENTSWFYGIYIDDKINSINPIK